mmetsp:Transcript_13427/g.16908  ORF Transcript_13427/g.16908 Transcript_13427/m.16908 type:complete len:220 (+) Transcript_13427:39-698(+)
MKQGDSIEWTHELYKFNIISGEQTGFATTVGSRVPARCFRVNSNSLTNFNSQFISRRSNELKFHRTTFLTIVSSNKLHVITRKHTMLSFVFTFPPTTGVLLCNINNITNCETEFSSISSLIFIKSLCFHRRSRSISNNFLHRFGLGCCCCCRLCSCNCHSNWNTLLLKLFMFTLVRFIFSWFRRLESSFVHTDKVLNIFYAIYLHCCILELFFKLNEVT